MHETAELKHSGALSAPKKGEREAEGDGCQASGWMSGVLGSNWHDGQQNTKGGGKTDVWDGVEGCLVNM